MRVNTYEVDADGTERLMAENVHIEDCFPDAGDEMADVIADLEMHGETWCGGGAAPLFLLMLVR